MNETDLATPFQSEAEIAVLSCVMQADKEVLMDILHGVREEHFHDPKHVLIWRAILTCVSAGKHPALPEILSSLDAAEKAAVGKKAYLLDVLRFCDRPADWKTWAAALEDYRWRRSACLVCREVIAQCANPKKAASHIKDFAEGAILGLDIQTANHDAKDMKEDSIIAMEQMETLYTTKGSNRGLATGFMEFDRILFGLRPAELTIIAARPSVGKTSVAMGISENLSISGKHRGLFFSLEMSRANLVERQLMSISRISLQALIEQRVTDADFKRLATASAAIGTANLEICDKSPASIAYILGVARRSNRRKRLDYVIVDYLQLASGSSRRAKENRVLEVGEIAKGLKDMAKELNIPVIALAQLNRKPEDRKEGKPLLSDLRDSGELEQDGDVIILMHKKESDEADHGCVVEFNIAKNRNGQTGRTELWFDKAHTRFHAVDP